MDKLLTPVNCAVCKARMHMITGSHLATHGLTIKEYIERYPNAPLWLDEEQAAEKTKGLLLDGIKNAFARGII